MCSRIIAKYHGYSKETNQTARVRKRKVKGIKEEAKSEKERAGESIMGSQKMEGNGREGHARRTRTLLLSRQSKYMWYLYLFLI